MGKAILVTLFCASLLISSCVSTPEHPPVGARLPLEVAYEFHTYLWERLPVNLNLRMKGFRETNPHQGLQWASERESLGSWEISTHEERGPDGKIGLSKHLLTLRLVPSGSAKKERKLFSWKEYDVESVSEIRDALLVRWLIEALACEDMETWRRQDSNRYFRSTHVEE